MQTMNDEKKNRTNNMHILHAAYAHIIHTEIYEDNLKSMNEIHSLNPMIHGK